MSKHTPAPWILRETSTHITVVGANNEVLFHDDKRIDGVVEDAKLISAAPELLSNLQFAISLLTPIAGHTAQVERMRDAIAKATGG